MIKKINLLIKYGKASMSGFKVSLFIMQQPLASAGKGKEKKSFSQDIAPPMLSLSLHKQPVFNITSLIYDCRSYLTVACGLMGVNARKISKP